MALKDTILDVRNMQRSIQLRGMEDPTQVTALLAKIVKEAVVAQASGSRTFERKAIAELDQIRQDLIAGQINAGGSKEAMVGIYSHLLDQMNAMQKDNAKSSVTSDKAFKQLSKSIPSADTFISALMTANPLVGYGVKIARDIIRATRVSADDQKAEQAKKLKNLKAQEKYIKDQLKVLAVEESAAKKALDAETVKEKTSNKPKEQRDIYMKILTDIHVEMQKLVNEWTGNTSQGITDAVNVDPSNIPIIVGLEQVEEEIAAQTSLEEKLSHDEIAAIEENEKKKERDSTLERMKEGGDSSGGLDITPINDAIGKEKGGFLKLLEGLIAPVMLLLRSSLIAFVGTAAVFLAEFVAIPALIGVAIYKFLDGFFNAEAIIGKATSDITMLDRVKAGVANIYGTILKILDWVTNLFGFDFFDSKNIEKKIYGLMDDFQHTITTTFEKVVSYGKDKYNSIVESAIKIYDDIFGIVDNTAKFITGKYDQLKNFFDSLANKGIMETFRDMMTTPEDPSQSPHRQYDSEWMGPDGDIPKLPGTTYQGTAVPNPDIIRMSDPGNRKNMETEASNGKQISGNMRIAEVNAKRNNGNGAPTIIAPSTTNHAINNNSYNGPPTTANLDPDFRSMMARPT